MNQNRHQSLNRFFRSINAAIVLFLSSVLALASNDPDSRFYVTDGTVNATLIDGATVYIGGDFSYVGPNTGHGAGIVVNSATTAGLDPHIAGTGSVGVYAVVSDGADGWYVGGKFSKVGTTDVANLVHINSARQVTAAFDPNPNDTVRALALSADGTTLYVGGDFTEIDGAPRNRLAAVKTDTGAVTVWSPNLDNTVYDLLLDDTNGRLFVGGRFASGAAAYTFADGNPVANWATNANVSAGGVVYALALNADQSTLFVGGEFTNVGGAARSNIGSLVASSGLATTWNPGANQAVHALAYRNDATNPYIFAGGAFTNIGATNLNRIARLNPTADTATTWGTDATTPHSVDNTVYALAVINNTLYAGGDFVQSNGAAVAYNAAFPTADNGTSTWALTSDGFVRALEFSTSGSTLYVGGEFKSVGGSTRSKIAALNINTGGLLPWKPTIDNGSVHSLAVGSDSTELFVGGSFTSVNNTTRNRIAKLHTGTNISLYDWAPSIEAGTVYSLAITNDGAAINTIAVSPANGATVLAGTAKGLFRTTDGGATWSQIDLGGTANVNDIVFDPNSAATVYASASGLGIFFSTDSGATWQDISAGLSTNRTTAIAISADSSRIYVGTQLISATEGGLHVRDSGDTQWRAAARVPASTLAVEPSDKNLLYIGTSVGAFISRNGGSSILRADQGLTERNIRQIIVSPNTDSTTGNRVVYAVAGSRLFRTADKAITWLGEIGAGLPSASLTRLTFLRSTPTTLYTSSLGGGVYVSTDNGSTFTSLNSGLDTLGLYALALDPTNDSTLYAGGTLGRLFKTTDGATTWSAAETGIPHSLLFAAGDFTGTHPNYLAQLNSVGTADYFQAWSPNPDAAVNTVKLSSDAATLYAGGAFTTIGGEPRRRIAALNVSDAAATTWAPSVDDGAVNAIAFPSTKSVVYLGGSFTSVNATTRNRLAEVSTASGDLQAWDPNMDGPVNALALSANDATLFVAGNFANVDAVARQNLAALYLHKNTETATLWTPDPNAAITGFNGLARLNNTLLVGGTYTRIGTSATRSFAGFTFTPPSVAASPRGSAFPDPQSVELTCTTTTAVACGSIFYTTDSDLASATWQLYNTNIPISTSTRLSFYVFDVEGTRSETKTEIYTIDNTSPTLTATPLSGTYQHTQTVTLACNDGDGGSGTDISIASCSKIFFTTNGSQPRFTSIRNAETGHLEFTAAAGTFTYSRPVPIVIDATIRYLAADKAGNQTGEQQASYKIERIPGGGLDIFALIALALFKLNRFYSGTYRRQS